MSTLKTNNIQHVDRSDPSIIINTDGSVNIAGTMTYEDVTNVDAVGIITGRDNIDAQKQVHVGTGVSVKAGGINVTAGITTVQALQATTGTFSSDVSLGDDDNLYLGASNDLRIYHNANASSHINNTGLLNIDGTSGVRLEYNNTSRVYCTSSGVTLGGDIEIADKIVHEGDTNTAIRFPAADTFTVETAGTERLRINSSGLVNIGAGSSASGLSPLLHLHKNASSSSAYFHITNNDTGITNNDGFLLGINPSGDCLIFNKDSTPIRFATAGTERLRIASDGNVTIGNDGDSGSNPSAGYDELCIEGGNENIGMCFLSPAANDVEQTISFGDSNNNQSGKIQYEHANDAMHFDTGGSERLRINSSGNANFTGIVTATSFVPTLIQLSHKNIIINGDCRIAQRGTSSTSSGYKTIDRFKMTAAGANATLTQAQVDVSSGTSPYVRGFRKAFKITNAGQNANNQGYVYMLYQIEAQDIATSGWRYMYDSSADDHITVSFWVKASVTQTYLFFLHTVDGTTKEFSHLISLTGGAWTKVSITAPGNSGITIDNDNGPGLNLYWCAYLGDHYTSGSTVDQWVTHAGYTSRPDMGSTWWTTSNATFELTGVQLEVGKQSTPFEHRSHQDELMRCYRYFYAHSGEGVNGSTPNPAPDTNLCTASVQATTSVSYNIPLPVPMRAVPTIYSTVTGSTRYRVNSSGANTNSGSDPTINTVLSTHDLASGAIAGFSGLVAGQAANVRRYLGTGILGFQAEF